jgi:hypothetical protein
MAAAKEKKTEALNKDLKDLSFVRSLCLGDIVEDIIFPYPKIKESEKETIVTVASGSVLINFTKNPNTSELLVERAAQKSL